jgi:LuxR family maltose regulon positive regulatory protein
MQPVPIDILITYLVNDLAQLEQPVVLVLDDYHQIREQAIHHAITFLVDNQPPNLYLVLTARRNPPFPLARWRARGHLVEVRRDDLKFTRQEIETFFQQATGVNLDQDSLKTLEQMSPPEAPFLNWLQYHTIRVVTDHTVCR